MRQVHGVGVLTLILLLCNFFGHAQQPSTGGQPAGAIVPPLVNFSGALTDGSGKPLNGVVGVTFYLYKDSQGGSALWMETQNVQPDKAGHYKVMLGSASAQGLPAELFASGEARWLGVQAQGEKEQPRVLLLSVPYALKALDAETLGGKPASAFVASSQANSLSGNGGINNALSGSGKKNYVPLWLSGMTLGDSKIFQNLAGDLGIGTTTPMAQLDVNGTSDLRNTLTLFPNGSAPTLSINGTAFSVSNTGLVGFVKGQTFPGAGTITGVTAGAGLGGGGTKGNVTLSVPNSGITNNMLQNSSLTVNPGGGMTGGGKISLGGTATLGLENCSANQVLEFIGGAWTCSNAGTGTITGVTAGTDLTGGGSSNNVTLNLDTTKVPQLNAANTFTGNQSITVNNATQAVAVSQNGSGFGVFSITGSGTAMLGYSTASSGSTTGVEGLSGSSTGTGVFGEGGTGVVGVGSSIGGSFSSNGTILQGTNASQKVEFSVDGGGNISTNGQVTATGNGLGVLMGNVGCPAPTIGIQATSVSANCQDFVLGFDGNKNDTYLNRPAGGTLHFREGNSNDQAAILPGGAMGIGTSTPNAQLDIRGSAGNSGFGIAADSSAWQARGASGWVKAMAYVDPFPCQGCGIAITRCYNSQQVGSATTAPPCGMTINHTGQGTNVIDFGFQVTDRFTQVQTQTSTASINFNASFTPSAVINFDESATQLVIFTFDPQANTGQISNPVDVPFNLFIF
jgi:predicted RNA-binding Zn-ribbon protein involved in translation (DUF1610 family)